MAKIIRFSFLFFVIISNTFVGSAQVVDGNKLNSQQVLEIYQKAKESGMSDSEIEAAALAKGASIEDIKKAKDNLSSKSKGDLVQVTERELNGEGGQDVRKDLADKEVKGTPSRVYGADIFRNNKISFEPNLRIPTPKNYILGPSDELMIDISGYAQVHYTAKVSPEGSIKIENLNPIYVSGLSIESASERIVNRLRSIFPGLNMSKSGVVADITLGNIRSIKIMMIGEVTQPGTYTLPSLATAFNALYAAGGPTDKGTFRNIEIYRNGKPFKKLDIYDFLIRGDQRNNIILQDQDLIRIPVVKRQIDATGAVKLPRIFEIEESENLGTVLDFAGGFEDVAYKKYIHVERVTGIEREAIGIEEQDIKGFQLMTGDKVVVDKILERFNNLIAVSGAVNRVGNLSVTQAKTVKGALAIAGGLLPDAYTERAFIYRLNETGEKEIITFNLKSLLENKTADIVLLNKDSLRVNFFSDIKQVYSVSLTGEVKREGQQVYKKDMSLADAIVESGGFTDGANIELIEVARRIKVPGKDFKEGDLTQIIQFKVDKDLKILADEKQQMLEPYDQIIVRSAVNYVAQRFVSISGEVNYPGRYAIQNSSERISDIIKRAGGLRKDAYLHGTQFKKNGKVVGVELQNVLNSPGEINDLFVENGDDIEVPKFKQTVEISGQVLNPLSLVYTGSTNVRDYINQAGGLTDTASTKRIYVKYINGKAAQTKSFLGFRKYPKVESGAVIYVPVRKRKEKRISLAEAMTITSTLSSLGVILFTVLRLNTNN